MYYFSKYKVAQLMVMLSSILLQVLFTSMNRFVYFKLVIIFNIIVCDEAARILGVFPWPSISHQVVYRPLIKELVNRGHEVTVITPDPMYGKGEAPTNLTEIDVHDISYAEWGTITEMSAGKKSDMYTQLKVALELITRFFEKQINSEEVQCMLNDEQKTFDLILTEMYAPAALVFSHLYKAPAIQVSSFGPTLKSLSAIGAPTHPLLYPLFSLKRIYNLTMWEKITGLYDHYWLNYMIESHHEEIDNDMLRRNFGEDIPSINELYKNVHMLLLNIHPIWADNRPVPPSVIYMGGVHQRPEEPLPKDLKDYLDSSVNGVIYMSFGTNTVPSLLPQEKIQLFVRVFSRLPYDILWKWDKDRLPGQTKNIRIGKWFPQSDLLRHPKIKLFITQGGLQSSDEAITAGVPLLGIPMLGDQWYNTEKYVHHKIGLQIDFENLTEEGLKNAVNKIIGDKRYRDNVVRLRTLMRDQPQTPLARAAWWTEHVLRHRGGSHLRAPAANMPWTHYYEIELVLTLFGALIVFVSVCVFVLCKLCSFVRAHFMVKNKVKKN